MPLNTRSCMLRAAALKAAAGRAEGAPMKGIQARGSSRDVAVPANANHDVKTGAVQALKRSTAGRAVVGVGLEVGFENQDTRDSRIVVRAHAANASRRRLCPCVHSCAVSAAELDLPALHLHLCHTWAGIGDLALHQYRQRLWLVDRQQAGLASWPQAKCARELCCVNCCRRVWCQHTSTPAATDRRQVCR